MIGADKFVHKLVAERQIEHATQRYTRGFSDIDMWNFDVMLADLIAAGCDWFLSSDKCHTSGPAGVDTAQWRAALEVIRDEFRGHNAAGHRALPSDEAWELLKAYFPYLWD